MQKWHRNKRMQWLKPSKLLSKWENVIFNLVAIYLECLQIRMRLED